MVTASLPQEDCPDTPHGPKSCPAPPSRVSWVVVGAGVAATPAQYRKVAGSSGLWLTEVPWVGGELSGWARVIRSPSIEATVSWLPPTVMPRPQRKFRPSPDFSVKLVRVGDGLGWTVELIDWVKARNRPTTTITAAVSPESTYQSTRTHGGPSWTGAACRTSAAPPWRGGPIRLARSPRRGGGDGSGAGPHRRPGGGVDLVFFFFPPTSLPFIPPEKK